MVSSKTEIAKILGLVFLGIWLSLLLVRAFQQGIYSSRMGINVLVFGRDSAGLLMLRPEEEMVGWVSFPNNLMIKIFNSEARYPINSVWDYGVMEKNAYQVAEKSVGLSMGVVIARTMKVAGRVGVDEVLGEIASLRLKTDLSVRDRVLIRKFLAESVASKKVLEMDLPNNIFDKTVEPDGRESLAFGSVATLWTKNKFVLDSILSESVELVVNNLSGQTGLGTAVARQLESAGMRVVEVKSDPTEDVLGQGCLYASVSNFPLTESLLLDQLACVKTAQSAVRPGERGVIVWLK